MNPAHVDTDRELRSLLWRGLSRLGPRQRIAFVEWCCRQVSFIGHDVRVIRHSGNVQEAVNDIYMLAWQHGLSLQKAAVRLEQLLR